MTIAQELAKNVHALYAGEFPAAAITKAVNAILDTVGVTLAGSRHQATTMLRKVVLPTATPGPALVVGTGHRVNIIDAAHLNGMSAHMLDYDDSNSQLHGHPSVAILPALLASAEQRDASGRDIINAYITGLEMAGRLGLGAGRFQYTHGWHPTSTVGIFGGIAAASALLGLTESQTANALGIASSMAAGLKANFGSMTKPLHVAQAARNGLLAVQLAREGFTANPAAFEAPAGYLNVFDRSPENFDPEKIVGDWGKPLCILNTEYGIKQKRFPCCYACLPPGDGVLELVEKYDLTPPMVEKIEVSVHPIRFPHINNPDPRSALEAKFSLHFCVARLVAAKRLAIEDFEGEGYNDAATRDLMARVSLSAYQDSNIGGAEVRVRTTDGRMLETRITAALGGSYDHPLPERIVRQKFDDCAGRVLGAARTSELYDRLRHLDSLERISDLTRMMTP